MLRSMQRRLDRIERNLTQNSQQTLLFIFLCAMLVQTLLFAWLLRRHLAPLHEIRETVQRQRTEL